MKNFFVFLFALLLYQTASSQLVWPSVSNETKPWTRWWWEGSAVDKENISELLAVYNKAGLGGVEITPIYGVRGAESQFIDFLSPKWISMLKHTLTEASKLNMGVDMATGTGWPFGGPWVKEADASKYIAYKVFTVKAGEKSSELVQYLQPALFRSASYKFPDTAGLLKDPVTQSKNLQALAIDQVQFSKNLPLVSLIAYNGEGKSTDITSKVDKSGSLNWSPVSGNATVYALFEGLHGKMVERAAPGGEGPAIDHFSLPAINNYLNHFTAAFKGQDISSMRGFFNDSYEVDDARGQSNWTPLLFTEFMKRRGYDLRNQLPALFGKEEKEKGNRVLYDYRQTIAELILENFTKPWAAWAKTHNGLVRNQSHGSPGNTMDLYAAVDIPETEGTEILRFKFATSAAHVTGKKLASAEAATWLNEHFLSTLADAKNSVDRYFVGGVNHIVYHGTNYSPKNETWPGWLFYAAVHFHPNNPFWNDFHALNKYVTRTQSFLQKGKSDNDILVYYPFDDSQMERGRDLLKHYDAMRPEFTGTNFNTVSETMLDKGYAFDFISDKQLSSVTFTGGKLSSGGTTWSCLMLPGNKYIQPKTFEAILSLVRAGAKLVVYKSLPAMVPGFGGHDVRQKQLDNFLSAIKFRDINGQVIAQLGKGTIIMEDDIVKALSIAKIRNEPMVEKGLAFTRRTYGNGHAYFITNFGKEAQEGWLPLAVEERHAGIFDPMTGTTGVAQTMRDKDGYTNITLHIPPGQSLIVQTSTTRLSGSRFPFYKNAGTETILSPEWKLSFTNGGPAIPASQTLTQLKSWTTIKGQEYERFSGTGIYTCTFQPPAKWFGPMLLNLGVVKESAEVWLNGAKLQTLIGPVFELVIPADKLLIQNKLEIRVSNSMANRIIGLEKDGVNWKKFYNTNFPSRLAENRGKDNLFTAEKWDPVASGLIGPVTLTPITFAK